MGETKLTKGSYGYIDNWKRTRLITLVLWVIFIGALLLIPMMVLGTKYNAFTVAAIVMVLPAARQAVQYIAMAGFRSGSREEYEKIASYVEGKSWMVLAADMVLASESGHMVLNMIVICNGNIYGYAPKQKKSREAIEAYLTNLLMETDVTHKKPVVHESFDEFEEMIMMLSANEPSAPMEAGSIFAGLKANCI
ncbi:hypothetical protein [Frisingicoccus sp.]|uniref:hypothetical protein n=1 Tax=Frisingicoccus sp. TaxID=1918627 RepID=UPI003993C38C